MSTQRNYSKQSLRGKVSNSRTGGDNRLKVAAHSRLPKLNNINIRQERRRKVYELIAQITVMDGKVKAGLIKKLFIQSGAVFRQDRARGVQTFVPRRGITIQLTERGKKPN